VFTSFIINHNKMEFQEKAILLTAESKPYNVGGNAGTSHKIRVSINGEIYVCNSNHEQVEAMKPYQGKSGVVVIKMKSRKENLSLELITFDPENS